MTLVLVRIALLVAAALVTAAVVALLTGSSFSVAPTAHLSSLYFIPVNVLCWWLLARRLRDDGRTVAAHIGFEVRRLGRDIAQGLLLMFLLFLPFAAAINLTMLLLFGPEQMFTAFETVFAPAPSAQVELPLWFAWSSALAVAALFPITNAPVEELYYRGHAQAELRAAGVPVWLALLLPSLAFGIQHVMLAPSGAGMLVYAAAFFAWGLAAGVALLHLGRLMPLIIAHLFTNAMTAVVPLILLLTGVA